MLPQKRVFIHSACRIGGRGYADGAFYYFYGRPPTRQYEPEAVLRQVMQRYR